MSPKLNCVLLIDDDEPTNFLHQMVIEESGCACHVKAVQSGEAALEYLTRADHSDEGKAYPCPDLIFLDLNMPAMNGWEFLDKYKKLSKEQQGKVIMVMLTTSMFPEDRHRSAELPEVAGFENKPLTPEKLNMILKKYFPDKKNQ